MFRYTLRYTLQLCRQGSATQNIYMLTAPALSRRMRATALEKGLNVILNPILDCVEQLLTRGCLLGSCQVCDMLRPWQLPTQQNQTMPLLSYRYIKSDLTCSFRAQPCQQMTSGSSYILKNWHLLESAQSNSKLDRAACMPGTVCGRSQAPDPSNA